jgi:hypothetical protein
VGDGHVLQKSSGTVQTMMALSRKQQKIIMGPDSVVECKWEPGLAHGFALSHHEASPLPNTATRNKQNDNTCRAASCLSAGSRPAPAGFGFSALLSVFAVLLLCSSLFGTASAADGDRPTLLAVHVEDDLAWKGSSLSLDHRAPPTPPLLMPPLYDEGDAVHAAKRAVSTDPNAPNSDFTVPEPFDTGLSSNFTNGCTSFLNRLRSDNTFRKCHPFSLLLQVCLLVLENERKILCKEIY